MKVLFVPSKYKIPFSFKNINLKKLPKTIGLITTIQHANIIKKIKDYLEKNNKKVIIGKSKFLEKAQMLGCDVSAATKIQNKIQAFLYVGSGKFHSLQLALTTNKPVFIFNPLNEHFSELDKKEIQKIKARKRGQKIKFLYSDVFGILVSTKLGQNKLKEALNLKEKLDKQKKKAYIFTFNTLDTNQLENYPSIECWINTACPGLSLEQPFIWHKDI